MATVLVTGASRGLGLEFTRQYLQDDWQVLAACRRPTPELEALTEAYGGRLEVLPLDLADDASIAALGERLAGRAIDVLLNNAGTMGRANFAGSGLEDSAFGRSDPEDWLHVFRINVIAPMKIAETLVENVAAGGQKKIVTLTSMLGSMGLNTVGGLYAYRASKAAVNAMMKSMAIDLGKRGILAAPIHPGWVRTAMGGPNAQIDAVTSVSGVREVIAQLDAERAGRLWAYDGSELPW
jgi:NAD(P)-dependent dehydrogenase (short-subunit alcohol dehydrogenase family)